MKPTWNERLYALKAQRSRRVHEIWHSKRLKMAYGIMTLAVRKLFHMPYRGKMTKYYAKEFDNSLEEIEFSARYLG